MSQNDYLSSPLPQEHHNHHNENKHSKNRHPYHRSHRNNCPQEGVKADQTTSTGLLRKFKLRKSRKRLDKE